MTTYTTVRKRQRRHARLELVTVTARTPLHIVVSPAPTGGSTPNASRAPELHPKHVADDLDQATWEDAEWR